jgi:hypothetical protein
MPDFGPGPPPPPFSGLIATTPFSLQVRTTYGLRTSIAAMILHLPLLAGVQPGDWIWLTDVDFNANNHNASIVAAGADQVSLYGVAAGSQPMNQAGVRVQLMANIGAWSMTVG